jgi:hypothetical protein
MTQLIDKEKRIFGVKNKTFEFVKPYYLLPSNEFKLKKATVKGSSLVWNIFGTEVSFNQLKELLGK